MFKPKPLKPVFCKFAFRTLRLLNGLFSVVSERIKSISFGRQSVVWLIGVLLLITGWFPLYKPTPVEAATPTLNFQARLENNAGAVVPDGYYNVQFKLYQGGTATGGGVEKWTEIYQDSNGTTAGNDNRVRIANGYLTVNLGSITSFPSTINWDDDLYLSMNIGGRDQTTPVWDGEMTPYLKLTSVPYAFQAQSASQLEVLQGSHTGTLLFGNLTADRRYVLPDTSLATTASPGTICVFNGDVSNCPAATGSAYYIHNDTALQTSSNFNIQAKNDGTAGTVGGVIRGAAGGQTVDLLQLQATNGTTLAAVTASGNLQVASSIDTRTAVPLSVGTGNASSITIGQAGVATTVTGTLTVSEAGTFSSTLSVAGQATLSGGATIRGLTVDSATATNDTLRVEVNNIGADSFQGMLTTADLTAARTWTLPDESGTLCTDSPDSSCSSLGSYIQNQNSAAQTDANFWIDGTGTAGTLQAGTVTATTVVQTPSIDTASATALGIGTSSASAINIAQSGVATTVEGTLTVEEAATFNDNLTVAAGKTIRLTGDTTTNRPLNPAEGTLYYDTTTHQLLVYNGSKWMTEGSETIMVAATDSGQAAKDAADYVANGSDDQIEINQALTAGAGKKVYLMPGTYTVSASISVPNNTTLIGAGNGTVITIGNGFDNDINLIVNSDTSTGTGVVIQDLRLDGNEANQTTGDITGIYLDHMGDATTARGGAKLSNIETNNFTWSGIYLNASANSTITGNVATSNDGGVGIGLDNGSVNNTVVGNVANHNETGIAVANGSDSNTISGNTLNDNGTGIQVGLNANTTVSGNVVSDNTGNGIVLIGATGATVVGNTVTNNGLNGVSIVGSNDNTITANTLVSNGGATDNNAIRLSNSDNNSVVGNTITDVDHSGSNYAINISNATANANYLANNTLGGGTINDAASDTIYAGQIKDGSNGNYYIQPAGNIELMGTTNVTGDLSVSGAANFNGGGLDRGDHHGDG